MSVAEDFARELSALLAPTGPHPPVRVGSRACARSGELALAVDLTADRIAVDLSGWRHTFEIADDEDDEDGEDAAALALDLIGAALYGALRIHVDSYDGVARRFTLQLRDESGWHGALTQGSRPWNPLARRSSSVHVGATPRPPQRAAIRVTALPWAPWAGLAGFFGAGPASSSGPLPVELPVDGELDLHNFPPREIKPLVLAYLDACLARGITEVRIVHGKGIGNLRRTVHAILGRHPRVKGFRLGGHGGGSWGATLVDLSPEPGPADEA